MNTLKKEILMSDQYRNFLHALGPTIVNLLENKDKDIEEIMRNSDGSVWVDRKGKGEEFIGNVQSDIDAIRTIQIVASATKRICNAANPFLSGEIPGLGYRFQGVMPDIVESAVWTIRIPSDEVFTLDDYVKAKIMTQEEKDALVQMIIDGWNLIVAGGTSSGKTTLLNAILKESSKLNLRHVIIEDTYELKCSAKNKVVMHSNDYGSMEDILETTMRLRPKHIIIGEAKSGAVTGTFIRSCNTGHKGIKVSLHCNSAKDALLRIEELLEEDGKIPSRRSIARAVRGIIFIEEIKTAPWRKVKEIVEVMGYENGDYVLKPIIKEAI